MKILLRVKPSSSVLLAAIFAIGAVSLSGQL